LPLGTDFFTSASAAYRHHPRITSMRLDNTYASMNFSAIWQSNNTSMPSTVAALETVLIDKGILMKTQAIALSLLVSLMSFSGMASAKGCIKGAVVGGAAGHVAGGHGGVGAAAGCAVGHHRASKKEKAKEQEQAQATQQQSSGASNTGSANGSKPESSK
jgi:hypothetical protein